MGWCMAQIRRFSYRLKIAVEPQWAEIIKQVVGLRNNQEQKDFGERLKNHLRDDRMLHRHYDFTEFFDSHTGLTAKFQRVHANGKTHSAFVNEFADAGRRTSSATDITAMSRHRPRRDCGILAATA